MAEPENNFELYTKLVAKICETKLAYLISKEVKLEYLEHGASKIIDKKIKLEKESLALSIPLEAIKSSLVIYSDLDQIPPIADIFAGGDGEVPPTLSDSQKLIFIDTTTQLLTAIFKYLVFKDDSLRLKYGETKDQILDSEKEQSIDMLNNSEAIAFKLKLTINGSHSLELNINIEKERYTDFLKKLEKAFPNLDLDSVGEKLITEMNSSKLNSRQDLDLNTKSNKEDSHYRVDEKRNLNFISDVNLDLIVELGRVEMEFSDVLNLTKGSAIELDRHCSSSVDLYVHNQLVARGEVIAIDDCFGLKLTEVLGSINLFKDLNSRLVS